MLSVVQPGKIVTAPHNDYTIPQNVTSAAGVTDSDL